MCSALQEKLGPILWQLPPTFRFEPERIEAFLALLPHDTAAALRLARSDTHGCMVAAGSPSTKCVRSGMRWRSGTRAFSTSASSRMLRAHGVALVVAETARTWPMPQDVTADFMYLRLHGDRELYRGGYSAASIERWAKRIAAWHAGREPDELPLGAQRITAARARRASAATSTATSTIPT